MYMSLSLSLSLSRDVRARRCACKPPRDRDAFSSCGAGAEEMLGGAWAPHFEGHLLGGKSTSSKVRAPNLTLHWALGMRLAVHARLYPGLVFFSCFAPASLGSPAMEVGLEQIYVTFQPSGPQ